MSGSNKDAEEEWIYLDGENMDGEEDFLKVSINTTWAMSTLILICV